MKDPLQLIRGSTWIIAQSFMALRSSFVSWRWSYGCLIIVCSVARLSAARSNFFPIHLLPAKGHLCQLAHISEKGCLSRNVFVLFQSEVKDRQGCPTTAHSRPAQLPKLGISFDGCHSCWWRR